MVGNHNGGVMCPDSYLWMAKYHTLNRQPPLLGLGHDTLAQFSNTRLGEFIASGGLIRADYASALRALQSGYALMVYPGGDRDNHRAFRRRHVIDFFGRTGYLRLALEAGVPIVPLVSVGAHETLFILYDGQDWAERLGLTEKLRAHAFPVSLSLPWGLTIGPLPFMPLPAQITTQVLPPIYPKDYERPDLDHTTYIRALDELVRSRMQHALNRLAANRIPVLGKADQYLPPRGTFWGDQLRFWFAVD
jgi:1-acyl-sn-glycerol-3-phosphate acyltransferase